MTEQEALEILANLGEEEATLRRAVEALGRSGSAEAIDALVELRKDFFGFDLMYGDPEAELAFVELLVGTLRDHRGDPRVRALGEPWFDIWDGGDREGINAGSTAGLMDVGMLHDRPAEANAAAWNGTYTEGATRIPAGDAEVLLRNGDVSLAESVGIHPWGYEPLARAFGLDENVGRREIVEAVFGGTYRRLVGFGTWGSMVSGFWALSAFTAADHGYLLFEPDEGMSDADFVLAGWRPASSKGGLVEAVRRAYEARGGWLFSPEHITLEAPELLPTDVLIELVRTHGRWDEVADSWRHYLSMMERLTERRGVSFAPEAIAERQGLRSDEVRALLDRSGHSNGFLLDELSGEEVRIMQAIFFDLALSVRSVVTRAVDLGTTDGGHGSPSTA